MHSRGLVKGALRYFNLLARARGIRDVRNYWKRCKKVLRPAQYFLAYLCSASGSVAYKVAKPCSCPGCDLSLWLAAKEQPSWLLFLGLPCSISIMARIDILASDLSPAGSVDVDQIVATGSRSASTARVPNFGRHSLLGQATRAIAPQDTP